jgi:dihydropteroate synthase
MPHCETTIPAHSLKARGRVLPLDRRPLIMGVLNVTPDSFSDGGRFLAAEPAVARALEMVAEGADLIDIGAESTRPGANPIDEREELMRLLPVVEAVCRRVNVPVSVDTTKAGVAQRALELGASIINDVSALRFDVRMGTVIAESGAGVVLMHMQGTPPTMQVAPTYEDVVGEVRAFFQSRLEAAAQCGIGRDQIILDPGIGFGKRREDNLTLLAQLESLTMLDRPLLVGTSRKGFIGEVLNRPVDERLMGTAATCAVAILHGARLVRVHDVAPIRDLVLMLEAVMQRKKPEPEA